MTQLQYLNNYLLLARDFESGLDHALSSALFDDDNDDDLIPILNRIDDSDLFRPDSSRCSSLSVRSAEWVCPLKDSFPPYNHLFRNDTYQLPRAPPPTPLPTSPSVLPRCQNELRFEVPSFALGTNLGEVSVCAVIGKPVIIRRPSLDSNVEEALSYNIEEILENIPEPPCTLCSYNATAGFHSQTTSNNRKSASNEKNRNLEPHFYQFPPLTPRGHLCHGTPTPPPSICSEGSIDDDPENITRHSFLRQPYSVAELDYQLQLLSIQQKNEGFEKAEPSFVGSRVAENEHQKRRIRLRNKSFSSVGKGGETLGKRISRAIKRSLSR